MAGGLANGAARGEGMWEGGKPKRWRYAVPVVLIWLVVLAWVVRVVAG